MRDYDKESNRLHTCTTKTLDEVYRSIFKLGYAQAEKDTIERAVKWLDENIYKYEVEPMGEYDRLALLDDLKEAMEKEE